MAEPPERAGRSAGPWRRPLAAIALMLAGAIIGAPLCAWLWSRMTGLDFGPHASPNHSARPLAALALAAASGAVAGAFMLLGARLRLATTGRAAAGLALAGAALASGRIDELVRSGATDFLLPAIYESALLVVLLALGLDAAQRVSPARPSHDAETTDQTREPIAHPAWVLLALGVSCALAAGVVYVVAVTPAAPQCLAATILGALACTAGARLMLYPASRATLAVAALLAMSLLIPLGLILSPAPISRSALTADLHPLARVRPIDSASGALIGAALAEWWVRTLILSAREPDHRGRDHASNDLSSPEVSQASSEPSASAAGPERNDSADPDTDVLHARPPST